MKNDMRPQLRFPGFADAWVEKKLGEIGNTFTSLSGKTADDFGHGNASFIIYECLLKSSMRSQNGWANRNRSTAK